MSAGAGTGSVKAGDAYVLIGVNMKPLEVGLLKMQTKLKSAGNAVGNLGLKFVAIGGLATAAFGSAVKTFSEFDDILLAVQAKSGAVGEEFTGLVEKAKELGAATSFTAREVGKGMDFMAMAGFNAKQIMAGIPAVLDLARAGMLDLGRASDIVTDVGSAFGFAADEIVKVADVIAKTATSANTSVEQMGEAMKYVAPIARAAGQSIEETSAAIGILGNVGLKGSIAGTGLSIVMRKLSETSVQKKLEGIAEVVDRTTGEFRPLLDILRDVGSATKSMPGPEKLALFNELFSARGAKVALNLATAGTEIDRMRGAMDDATGSAKQMAEQMDKGVGGALRRAASAFEGLRIAIGESLGPAVKDLSDAASKYLQDAILWVKANRELVVTMAKVSAGILAVGASLLALKVAMLAAAAALTVPIKIIGFLSVAKSAVIAAKALNLYAVALTAIQGGGAASHVVLALAKAFAAFKAAGVAAGIGVSGAFVVLTAAVVALYIAWRKLQSYWEDSTAIEKAKKDTADLEARIKGMNDELEHNQLVRMRGVQFSREDAIREVDEMIRALKREGKTNAEIVESLRNDEKHLTKFLMQEWDARSGLSRKYFVGLQAERSKILEATKEALSSERTLTIETNKSTLQQIASDDVEAAKRVLTDIEKLESDSAQRRSDIAKQAIEDSIQKTYETAAQEPGNVDFFQDEIERTIGKLNELKQELDTAKGLATSGGGDVDVARVDRRIASIELEEERLRALEAFKEQALQSSLSQASQEQAALESRGGALETLQKRFGALFDTNRFLGADQTVSEFSRMTKAAQDFVSKSMDKMSELRRQLSLGLIDPDVFKEELAKLEEGLAEARATEGVGAAALGASQKIVGQFGAAGFAEKIASATLTNKTEKKILTESEKQTKLQESMDEKLSNGGTWG